MSHHVLGDIYRNEFLAVVHRDGVAHELRKDGRAPRPRAHHALLALGGESRDFHFQVAIGERPFLDRKSTRLNSSHLVISYAVFCLKKKKNKDIIYQISVITTRHVSQTLRSGW